MYVEFKSFCSYTLYFLTVLLASSRSKRVEGLRFLNSNDSSLSSVMIDLIADKVLFKLEKTFQACSYYWQCSKNLQ